METIEREFEFAERTSKKQPFDKRLILHMLDQIELGVPRRDLMEQYGVSELSLIRWMKKFGRQPIGPKRYTTELKRSVVRAVQDGMSAYRAGNTFDISCGTVSRWVREYKGENTELSSPKPDDMAKNKPVDPKEAEILALKKALEYANLKIRALDTMIDIAEEQLKIDIRKKSGAKRS